MSGVIQHVVGNVQFGPARSLWEEQPSLRELYDQACRGLVRAECEADELRAEVAMLQEQARILASERDEARPSPHLKQLPQDALLDADGTPETLSSVEWATDVSGWPTYLVVNALVAQKLERERDEARMQYRSTELLGMALVKTIDELKVERNEARSSLDRLATIACEAFGPFPVQPSEDNLTAIEQGIYQLRTDNDKLERERDEARQDLDEEMKFHHRTHGECVMAQCALLDVKNERDQARDLADSAMLEADKLRAKRGACIYEIAESVRDKYDPADEVDEEEL